jgi:putative DNA primase/helicase
MSRAAIVALALKGRRNGDGYLCRCPVPAHGQGKGDRNPSLLIRDGDIEGRVVIHCFAGCDPRDVLAVLRARALLQDHGDDPKSARRHTRARPDTSDPTLPLRTPPDADGRPKFFVADDGGPRVSIDELRRHVFRRNGAAVRIKIKYQAGRFSNWYRVRDADRANGWQAAKPADYGGVPYMTLGTNPFDPEVADDPLYWPEGEKDVDSLSRAGALAFTFGGVGDGLPPNAVEHIAGRHVVILADNDDAGRKHAQEKATRAHGVAASVRIIEFRDLAEKSDVSDWLALGHTADELSAVADAAPLWSPPIASKSTTRARELVFACLADIKPASVKWLWPDRIPRKFVLFTGPPDAGKTLTAIDISARITIAGTWPDGSGRAPLGRVIILTAEDGIADTIRTRAEAAGADLNRILCLQSTIGEDGNRSVFSLQADLARLGEKISTLGDVALVIVDPVTAYLGAGKIDTHKTSDVRAVLSPVTEFADELGITVLGLTHPPKNGGGKAINAATGSLAFIAAARSAYLFTIEAETGRTLVLPIKNNLGPRRDGLAFRISQRSITEEIIAPYVEWDSDPVTVTADEALAAESSVIEDHSALDEAMDFLREELQAGEVEAAIVETQARKAGIAIKTLKRARKKLGVISRREGFGKDGKFFLSLTRDHRGPKTA